MKHSKLPYLAAFTFIALAACEPANNQGDAPADSAAAAGDTSGVSAQPVVTNLDDVNDSGITGEATATHGTSEVTVSLLLKDGAKADVTYPAHIHTGTCERGGPVAVELSPVTNLQSTKTVALSSLPANQDAFVQVHDPSGKPVACGDMKGHDSRGAQGDSTHATTTH